MSDQDALLDTAERAALELLADQPDAGLDGQRARALLAVDSGQSQVDAAEAAGLTSGQLSYFLRKFREEGMDAFSDSTQAELEDLVEDQVDDQAEALQDIIAELNAVVAQLQALIPDSARRSMSATYSPQGILVLIRDNVNKLTPDMQVDLLRTLQGMSVEDMMDLDTWKGMGYMMTYSARFQTMQALEKMNDAINTVVPEPIQPQRFWRFTKRTVDRVTPEFAKQIAGTLRDATLRDLIDPDTWKGVFYMISYSIQFQAEQLRDRLIESDNEHR